MNKAVSIYKRSILYNVRMFLVLILNISAPEHRLGAAIVATKEDLKQARRIKKN